MKIIQNGRADVMLCGGVESSITPLCTAGFAKVFTLSRRNDDPCTASRPFSRDRDGFVQGEGAGILLLESLEHAQQRGANIICELVGYSLSADAEHITTGNPKIWCQTMKEALKDSNITPETIDYINAHGTSTEINDKTEIEAIKMAFGSYAKNLSVSSTKGSTGHCLPAAGGLEAVFTAMVIKNKIVPPSANLSEVGDDCTGVRHIQTAENAEIEYAMSNSFGFGGFNAVIIMKRYCED
jgi:3-oxoacyl-[acyl-carrier-protein] synthase II